MSYIDADVVSGTIVQSTDHVPSNPPRILRGEMESTSTPENLSAVHPPRRLLRIIENQSTVTRGGDDVTADVIIASGGNCSSNCTGGDDNGDAAAAAAATAAIELQYHLLFLLVFPVITVFGNVLVSLSVYRERNLQTVTNYFIVSLAISDIMVAVLVMPLAVYVEVNNGEWNLGDALCDTWVAFDVMCCTASILNLTAISIDRFIAVTLPIQYAKHRNSKRALVTLSLTWVLSIIICSPIVLGINYTPRRILTPSVCTFYNADFLIFSSMGSFYIPCVAMLLLYWGIFRTIRRRVRKLNTASGSGGGGGGGGGGGATGTSGSRPTELATGEIFAGGRRRDDGRRQPRPGDEQRGGGGSDVDRRTMVRRGGGANKVRAAAAASPPDIRLVADLVDPDPSPTARGDQPILLGHDRSPVDDVDAMEDTAPNDVTTTALVPLSPGDGGEEHQSQSQRGSASRSSTFTVTSSIYLPSPQNLLSSPSGPLTHHYLPAPGQPSPCRKRSMDKFTANLCKKLSKATKCERKAVKTLAIVVGVFLVCWMPFFTINIINAVCIRSDFAAAAVDDNRPFTDWPGVAATTVSADGPRGTVIAAAALPSLASSVCQLDPKLFSFFVWLGYINSVINPIIYTLFNVEFRRAISKILVETCRPTAAAAAVRT